MRRSLTSVDAGTSSWEIWKPAYLAWSLAALSIIIVIISFILAIYWSISSGNFRAFISHQALTPFVTIAFTIVGALVASRHSRNPIGWLFLSVGILYAFNSVTAVYSLLGASIAEDGMLAGYDLIKWLGNWIWIPALILPTTFVFLYFPDGRLLSPRWRWVAWPAAFGLALSILVIMLHPGPLPTWDMNHNPFGFPALAPALEMLAYIGIALVVFSLVGAFIAFIVRFRRTRGLERDQMKWLVYALCLMGVGFVLASIFFVLWPGNELVTEFGIAVNSLSVLGIAIAASIAILRYRLYDIDLIINRTLVYGALTAGVVGIYVLVVVGVGFLFQQTSNLFISLLATGLAALVIQPLRDRLQRGINRLMYGERDDPYAVLSGLDRRLEESLSPETTLPIVVETVAQALKLPYVAVELADQDGFRPAASYGLSPTRKDQHIALPLVYQNERVGRLVLSPRSAGESFNPAEKELLADIARHVGVSANAVLLTENLQRSRERIVTAREEERRRLSRDLHDGLGPQLVSLGFKVEAAQNLLGGDQQSVSELLQQLKKQSKSALGDVRRIAYDLRPPALDQLGLVPAIHEHLTSLELPGGLEIKLNAPDDMPALPAAIEVAAYRIVLEAVTNVIHHSGASRCTVNLQANDWFGIEISDNGNGLSEHLIPGVGIRSMRDRTTELGGIFTIKNNPGGGTGTRITARLPLHPAYNSSSEGVRP
jgi:signal transduction histidine kinase